MCTGKLDQDGSMEEGNQEDMYVFKADEADGEFRRVGGH
jgi:hypothetical protein